MSLPKLNEVKQANSEYKPIEETRQNSLLESISDIKEHSKETSRANIDHLNQHVQGVKRQLETVGEQLIKTSTFVKTQSTKIEEHIDGLNNEVASKRLRMDTQPNETKKQVVIPSQWVRTPDEAIVLEKHSEMGDDAYYEALIDGQFMPAEMDEQVELAAEPDESIEEPHDSPAEADEPVPIAPKEEEAPKTKSRLPRLRPRRTATTRAPFNELDPNQIVE